MTSFPNINQRKRQGVTRKITQYGFLLLTEWLLTQTNCTFGWRLIILQYCSVFFFSYIDMNQPWIYMCSPFQSPLPHLHPIPLGLPSAPSPNKCEKKKNCTFSTFIAFTFKIKMIKVNHQIALAPESIQPRTHLASPKPSLKSPRITLDTTENGFT